MMDPRFFMTVREYSRPDFSGDPAGGRLSGSGSGSGLQSGRGGDKGFERMMKSVRNRQTGPYSGKKDPVMDGNGKDIRGDDYRFVKHAGRKDEDGFRSRRGGAEQISGRTGVREEGGRAGMEDKESISSGWSESPNEGSPDEGQMQRSESPAGDPAKPAGFGEDKLPDSSENRDRPHAGGRSSEIQNTAGRNAAAQEAAGKGLNGDDPETRMKGRNHSVQTGKSIRNQSGTVQRSGQGGQGSEGGQTSIASPPAGSGSASEGTPGSQPEGESGSVRKVMGADGNVAVRSAAALSATGKGDLLNANGMANGKDGNSPAGWNETGSFGKAVKSGLDGSPGRTDHRQGQRQGSGSGSGTGTATAVNEDSQPAEKSAPAGIGGSGGGRTSDPDDSGSGSDSSRQRSGISAAGSGEGRSTSGAGPPAGSGPDGIAAGGSRSADSRLPAEKPGGSADGTARGFSEARGGEYRLDRAAASGSERPESASDEQIRLLQMDRLTGKEDFDSEQGSKRLQVLKARELRRENYLATRQDRPVESPPGGMDARSDRVLLNMDSVTGIWSRQAANHSGITGFAAASFSGLPGEDSGIPAGTVDEEPEWKELLVESGEAEEKKSGESHSFALSALSRIPVANLSLRQHILPAMTQQLQETAGGSGSKPAKGVWQKHHVVLDDGKNLQLSSRRVDGVLQVKIRSSNTELNRLIIQHQQEIREHLEKKCGVQVDLQFEDHKQDMSGFGESFSSSGQGGDPGGKQGMKTLPEKVEEVVPKSVRRFGYNRMEWTA